jgi:hypothetical protein
LFEQSRKRTNFQLAVIGHDTARRTSPHDNVATTLASKNKPEAFQRANGLRT